MKIKKSKVSPRQKMINLMYVLLMAMLAMNVSSDVLNGFNLVDESLSKSTVNANVQNEALYKELALFMEKNPEKVRAWFARAQSVKEMSDSLYNLAQELKIRIAKNADGKNGDCSNLKNREHLEAATSVMLAPGRGRGEELYNAINRYRENILKLVTDSVQRQIIENNLSTDVPQKSTTLGKNWQEYHFENMPAIAAITLLTKLQNDVRYAEGEVLHTLANSIDLSDVRVNQIRALVIPNSKNVVRGGEFTAQIILAAVAAIICVAQFALGRKIGAKYGDTVAGGQSLGQKNTVLAVWMAQSFLNPISCVAPTAYIVWQNIVNSYQIYRKK